MITKKEEKQEKRKEAITTLYIKYLKQEREKNKSKILSHYRSNYKSLRLHSLLRKHSFRKKITL